MKFTASIILEANMNSFGIPQMSKKLITPNNDVTEEIKALVPDATIKDFIFSKPQSARF